MASPSTKTGRCEFGRARETMNNVTNSLLSLARHMGEEYGLTTAAIRQCLLDAAHAEDADEHRRRPDFNTRSAFRHDV